MKGIDFMSEKAGRYVSFEKQGGLYADNNS